MTFGGFQTCLKKEFVWHIIVEGGYCGHGGSHAQCLFALRHIRVSTNAHITGILYSTITML
jgi:hypothetical protein